MIWDSYSYPFKDRDKEAIENIKYTKSLYDAQVFKVKTERHIENLLLEQKIS